MKNIPYGKQNIAQDDIQAVTEVLRSDWITQGPKVGQFEKALANRCGAKYAVAVSSGTAALHIACLAASLGKGDEAITTPLTFLATANSVIYAGARPVFADIDPDTVNIDPDLIEKKISKKTKAILPVHFAGLPCDMPRISAIAKKKDLVVIEDACHALGAEYKYKGRWIKVGSCRHSDMTVFSFHPVKHITTGEGGAVTTNSRKIYEKLRALASHGMYRTGQMTEKYGPWYYEMRDLGFNYRITDFQSALGASQLDKLDMFLKKRRKIVNLYKKYLSGTEGIKLPSENEDKRSAWHIYVVRLDEAGKSASRRKKVFNQLRERGLGVQVHYIPVHLQPYYRKLFGYKKGDYPRAEGYYAGAITLPLYPGMTEQDVRYVADTFKECL